MLRSGEDNHPPELYSSALPKQRPQAHSLVSPGRTRGLARVLRSARLPPAGGTRQGAEQAACIAISRPHCLPQEAEERALLPGVVQGGEGEVWRWGLLCNPRLPSATGTRQEVEQAGRLFHLLAGQPITGLGRT